jgi:hypothetical protein
MKARVRFRGEWVPKSESRRSHGEKTEAMQFRAIEFSLLNIENYPLYFLKTLYFG